MRKIVFIVLSVLALFSFGCGSGGSSNTVSENNTETGKQEEYGSVVFRIELEKPDSLAKRLPRIPANTTGILVRAWDEVGHDVLTEIPITIGTTVIDAEIPLPVGTDYRIDAISYNNTGLYDVILTAGRSTPFEITANTSTHVSVTLESFSVDFTGTSIEVQGGDIFTVQAKITGPDILSGTALLSFGFNAWTADSLYAAGQAGDDYKYGYSSKTVNIDGTATYTISISDNAPTVTSPKLMYYQIAVWTTYKYQADIIPFLFLPSIAAGESLVQITVNPPTGGVVVNLN